MPSDNLIETDARAARIRHRMPTRCLTQRGADGQRALGLEPREEMAARNDHGHAGGLRRRDTGRRILQRDGLARPQFQRLEGKQVSLWIRLLLRRLLGAYDGGKFRFPAPPNPLTSKKSLICFDFRYFVVR